MGDLSVVAMVLAATAAGVACAPRPGPTRLRAIIPAAGARLLRPGHAGPPSNARQVRRGRAAAACLAGTAGVVIVGGAAGWIAGAALGAAAWVGLGKLEPAAVVRRRQQVVAALPLAADLLAAAVAAGAPPERAADAVGHAVSGPLGESLAAAAAATRVGSDPSTAWGGLLDDPSVRPLGRAMIRAASRGASPVDVLERVARDARDTARWAAEARARSVGARAAAPLGLCFLPAFVLVGIVPLIATLGMPLLP